MTNRPDISVASSLPTYVYVRTQSTTRCCVCNELTGGVAHLNGGKHMCLPCHVTGATMLWQVRNAY